MRAQAVFWEAEKKRADAAGDLDFDASDGGCRERKTERPALLHPGVVEKRGEVPGGRVSDGAGMRGLHAGREFPKSTETRLEEKLRCQWLGLTWIDFAMWGRDLSVLGATGEGMGGQDLATDTRHTMRTDGGSEMISECSAWPGVELAVSRWAWEARRRVRWVRNTRVGQ